jgi:pyruvate/2-oxoglutarate dehydrogenase complex dihydrolipoamide acyltransferase (E2) component
MNKPFEFKVPCENVNDLTAKIVAWKVASGNQVQPNDVIAELENSKATFEVTAPVGGRVEYSRAVDEEVPVGETLFYVHTDAIQRDQPPDQKAGEAAPTPSPSSLRTSPPPATQAPGGPASASGPVFSKRAQELVAELSLNSAAFAGMVFVKESDVRAKAQELRASRARRGAGQVEPKPPLAMDDEAERVPLERAKLLENRELVGADRAALKCTLYYFCPARGLQAAGAAQSPSVPPLVIILFETVKLLTRFRHLNARLEGDNALLYRHVHIGFAVDMGRGLKVLVIRNAEELSFAELAAKFEELLVKYNTDTLAVADVTGSTFTVTDLAQEGVFSFAPLLNARQAAILGVGAESASPTGGAAGFMLSCSFDHRLIGGKQVGGFMSELSARLVGHANSQPPPPAADKTVYCSRCLQTAEDLRAIRAFLLPCVEPAGYICTKCLAGD